MIKCLNMKKPFEKKFRPKKNALQKFQSMSTDETNDQMSETQFFLYFSMFFQDSRIEIILWYVC